MTDSMIKSIIDKMIEQIKAGTSITYVAEALNTPGVNKNLYAEIAFEAGMVKRQTVGKVLYQDVLLMIVVNGENLETVRQTIETLIVFWYNGTRLAALQALKVFDIHPYNVYYPTKTHGEKITFGHVVFEITLRFTYT